MSKTIMAEVTCDAGRCENRLRVWHWTTLPIGSMLKSKINHGGWVKVPNPNGAEWHFCPDHRATKRGSAYDASAKRAQAWERGA